MDGPFVDGPNVDGSCMFEPDVFGPDVDWPGVDGPNMSRSTLPTDWGCWKSKPRSWYLEEEKSMRTIMLQS